MESIVTAYGCEYRLLAAMPMLARMGEDNLLMVFDSKGRGELTPFYNQVRELALDIRAKLIGVDTAADTFGGNENDRGQVRQFVQRALGGLARDTCGSLVLLAHPSVAGMASGEGTGGNTGWSNAFRSRLYTERPKAVDGEDTDPDARVLSRKKANYASRDDAILMRWVNGVLTIPPPAANAFRPLCEDVYLSLLESCTASGNTPSPKFSASTYAPTMFSKLSKAQRQGYHKGEFERAQTALFNRQVITFEEVGPPARRRHVIVKTEMPE
jgi:RecA-family ATPase